MTTEQGGEAFARVPEDLLPATRKKYDGLSMVGEDRRQIDIRMEILTRLIRCKP